jgi:hypothetical protein
MRAILRARARRAAQVIACTVAVTAYAHAQMSSSARAVRDRVSNIGAQHGGRAPRQRRFHGRQHGEVDHPEGRGSGTSREIVDETAGTITFIETVAGVPELVKVTNGPVLSRDAGLVVNRVRVFEFDPATEEVGDLISDTWEFLAGPHPDLESGFEHFCEVVEPYLLDP